MDQTVRFQETLRKLAMIDEGFVEDEAGLGLSLAGTSALDPKTAALLQLGASVAAGPSAGSAESYAPLPVWRSRSGMTSRPRWRNRKVTDDSQFLSGPCLPASGPAEERSRYPTTSTPR
jgi:hypothetical protein